MGFGGEDRGHPVIALTPVIVSSCPPPTRFFSKPSLKNRNTVFTLGNRGSVIGAAELEGPIIVPHAAQKSDVRVSLGGGGGNREAERGPGGGCPDLRPSFCPSVVPLRVAVPQSALRSARQQLPRVLVPLRLLHGDGAQRAGPLQRRHGQDLGHVPGEVFGGTAGFWGPPRGL